MHEKTHGIKISWIFFYVYQLISQTCLDYLRRNMELNRFFNKTRPPHRVWRVSLALITTPILFFSLVSGPLFLVLALPKLFVLVSKSVRRLSIGLSWFTRFWGKIQNQLILFTALYIGEFKGKLECHEYRQRHPSYTVYYCSNRTTHRLSLYLFSSVLMISLRCNN